MTTPTNNVLTYKHPLGTLITVYYLNDVSDTVNVTSLDAMIWDIHNNFKKHFSTIFSKLTLNLWQKDRPDIPRTSKVCGTDGVCYTDLQIAEYAGLTWWTRDRIDLNSNCMANDQDLALLLSHELGHYIDGITDLDSSDDIIFPEWNRVRGIPEQAKINRFELYAEDILILHGCRLAKGHKRGEHSDARLVKGLSDLYLIWNPIYLKVKECRSQGYTISNVSYKYSNTDFNYFAVQFMTEKIINGIKKQEWWWIDRFAIYQFLYINNRWQWSCIKKFI